MSLKKTKQDFQLQPLPKDSGKTDAPIAVKSERGNWDSKYEFLLSVLGYAVGFGNVWRFPFLLYKNGGAAFLIPYIIMLFVAGFPLFFLELILGQYASLGPNILFAKMAPIMSGLGYSMVMVSILITIYYNLIFAWVLFYTFASFTSVLPWSSCTNTYNTPDCYTEDAYLSCLSNGTVYFNNSCIPAENYCDIFKLDYYNETHCASMDNSSIVVPFESTHARISSSEDYYRSRMLNIGDKDFTDMGEMQWEMVGCLALAWTIICLCMIKGVKSSGKVVYFTATFPYVVLLILFIRGVTLPGAYAGIEFYILKPNMTRLLEIEVWNDAATQIFYSMGVAAGVLITLSSYNKFDNNCYRDALFIAVTNSLTSLFAGFVIFSILGFMATELGVEVKDVVQSGSGLAFIAYPEAVSRMPISSLWSVLFFLMLVTLGIDSQFSYMETIITAILDKFESLRSKKALVTICVTFILFVSGLTMCLQGGVYMFELFVWYSSGISLITIALLEVVVVNYVFGFKNFMKIIKEMGITLPSFIYGYLSITWLFLTPASLIIILFLSIYYYVPAYYGNYVFPTNIQTLGWFMCASSIVFIPAFALYTCYTSGKTKKELFSSKEFVPAHVREALDQQKRDNEKFNYTSYDNYAYL